MFSDALQLAMIMPFILKHFLAPDNVILAELAALGNRLSSVSNQRRSNRQVINNIISCWVIVADVVAHCFKLKMSTGDLNHLQEALIEEHGILINVWYKMLYCQ